MLKVPEWSPPVPTMSTTLSPTSTVTAASSMASTIPVISSLVSPLARSPVTREAIWAEVARPAITSPMAARAASRLSDSPVTIAPSVAAQSKEFSTPVTPGRLTQPSARMRRPTRSGHRLRGRQGARTTR